MTSKKMVAVLLLLICSDAFAQQWCRSECTDALKEMKVSKVEVIGEEAVSTLVSDFCDEYSQSTITESALSAGGKYGGISAQMDQSKSTSEQLNKTYCASSDQSNASKQSYKLYLESISDRAYPAYQICLTGCQLGGLFVSELGGGDSERLLSVAFSPQNMADKEATVLATGVNGVTCRWDGESGHTAGTPIQIPATSTRALRCQKEDPASKGSITLIRQDATIFSFIYDWDPTNNREPTEPQVRKMTTYTGDPLINDLQIFNYDTRGERLMRIENATLTFSRTGQGTLKFQVGAMQQRRWRSAEEGYWVNLEVVDKGGERIMDFPNVAKAWVAQCGGYFDSVSSVSLPLSREAFAFIKLHFSGGGSEGVACER